MKFVRKYNKQLLYVIEYDVMQQAGRTKCVMSDEGWRYEVKECYIFNHMSVLSV